MKKIVVIFLTIVSSFSVFADDEGIQSMLTKTILEKNSLEKYIDQLRGDSISSAALIDELRLDTAKMSSVCKKLQSTNESLLFRLKAAETSVDSLQSLLLRCRKDSANLSKKLGSAEIIKSKQFKDSLTTLNVLLSSLSGKIDSVKTIEKALLSQIDSQNVELKKLSTIDNYLSSIYANATVDILYAKYSKSTLLSHKEMFRLLGQTCPDQLNHTLACYVASEVLLAPYNKEAVGEAMASLPANSKVASDLRSLLSNYVNLLEEGSEIWEKLATEVFKEPISNDNFDQITAKRKVWQSVQPLLTKYPNLSSEYPYLYSVCQKILSEIWINANNFPKSNPFTN